MGKTVKQLSCSFLSEKNESLEIDCKNTTFDRFDSTMIQKISNLAAAKGKVGHFGSRRTDKNIVKLSKSHPPQYFPPQIAPKEGRNAFLTFFLRLENYLT
ncbi:MAG: hypothetical protein RL757_1641 [Bacteroidota bacterium]|jgi:hypothetical protein